MPPIRRRGLVAMVQNGAHPRRVLAAIILMLLWPSLLHSFAVDDFRNLRLLEEFRQGKRDELRLYEFLRGGQDNRAQRLSGRLAWWVPDEFRFTYFRPVTQALLQAEYALFGPRPLGYRLVGLALYCMGVWLALALFRNWTGDELRSRWASVAFAVATCNGIPVVFIAAQCDLLALVGSVGAVLCASQYIRSGRLAWLAAAVPVYAAALLSKEASVAAAVLPLAFIAAVGPAASPDERRRLWRRGLAATAPLLMMSIAVIAYFTRAGYGTNGAMFLDPAGHPGEYLRRMPGRAVMLLSSWILPENPQWFDMFDWMVPWAILYLLVGGLALSIAAILLWRRHRRDPAVWAFALWVLPFLPLLACTNPDNRVMMLPTVGLSMLAAVWMTRRTPRLDWLPALLFLVFPFMTVGATVGAFGQLERTAANNLRAGVAAFDRPAGPQDHLFFLNSYWQFDAIWSQDRADFVNGPTGPRVAYLAHTASVNPEVLGPRALRLRAVRDPFLSTYPGRLVQVRGAGPPRPGTRFETGEFTATINEVTDGRMWAVDFEFKQPLDSPHYRFMRLNLLGEPERWVPVTATR